MLEELMEPIMWKSVASRLEDVMIFPGVEAVLASSCGG
jgi:hypothetical protein